MNLHARIRANGFAAWLRAYEYEAAGRDGSLSPPEALREELATCGLLLTSPARRATESADALSLRARRGTVPEAREIPLPARILCTGSHAPTTLVVLARTLWLLGLARADEDWGAVRLRASRLAQQLGLGSKEAGHVVLVGHGYLNRFLREGLVREGWRLAGRRAATGPALISGGRSLAGDGRQGGRWRGRQELRPRAKPRARNDWPSYSRWRAG